MPLPGTGRSRGSDEATHGDLTVDVGDYARYGVGLYRIEGETIGTPCTGWAYVNVTGPFPLFTVAGAVGGVLTVAGRPAWRCRGPDPPRPP